MSNKSTHCGILAKSKLKDLPDMQKFYLSLNGNVRYELNKLDNKKKLATYTSLKSGRTFVYGWGKNVWI